MSEDPAVQLVHRLGKLDEEFSLEFEAWHLDAEDFPHAIMMDLAGSLSSRFPKEEVKSEICETQVILLGKLMEQLETSFLAGNSSVMGMIKLSFIEPIYQDNKALFDYLLWHSGDRLRYQLAAHKTEMNGQMILTVIKNLYGLNPPSNLGEMCNNPFFVQMITGAGISITQEAVLDMWLKPYRFSIRVLPENHRRVFCVVSAASLRNFGEDIESCLAME